MKILKFLLAVVACFFLSGGFAQADPPDKEHNLVITETGFIQSEQGNTPYSYACIDFEYPVGINLKKDLVCQEIRVKTSIGFGGNDYSYISRHRRICSCVLIEQFINYNDNCKMPTRIRYLRQI